MNKFALIIATTMLSTLAYAQTDHSDKKDNLSDRKNDSDIEFNHKKDGFYSKEGKVFIVQDGKSTPINRDTTLSNYTIIFSDGQYTQKGGEKTKFKEGEYVDFSGRMRSADNSNPDFGKESKKQEIPDGYHVENGKTVVIKNGRTTSVDKDVRLSNGTIITSDGEYMMKGGRRKKINEGEFMDMSGKINQNRNLGDTDRDNNKINDEKDVDNNKNNRRK